MLPGVIRGGRMLQGRWAVLAAGAAAVVICSQAGAAARRDSSPPYGEKARSELVWTKAIAPDVTRYEYRYGPVIAAPGHNLILVGPVTIERPARDGYRTRVRPDLVDASGKAPPIEQVHMHHAVMLKLSHKDTTYPTLPQRFYVFAEEKTIDQFPPGECYSATAGHCWSVNYLR